MAATPSLRVESACARLGRDAVVARCLALLEGGDESPEFLITLGGTPAQRLLADGLPESQQYWLRVWAARGLLWAGPGKDASRLEAALDDASWRVREMICKVIARHRVDSLFDAVVRREHDANKRVRDAAGRAAMRLIDAG